MSLELWFQTRKSRVVALLLALWILLMLVFAVNIGESCDGRGRCSWSIARFLTAFLTLGVAPLLVILGITWVRAVPGRGSAKETRNPDQRKNVAGVPAAPQNTSRQIIQAYKKNMSVAGIVCLVAIIAAAIIVGVVDPKQSDVMNLIVPLLSLVAGVAFVAACWFHIKAKGRSGWWMLVLPLLLLGLLILILLEDHTTGDGDRVA